MNQIFLTQLVKTIATSGKTKAISELIIKTFEALPDVMLEVDKTGNILITKGIAEHYICLSAHMDEVFDKEEVGNRTLINMSNRLFSMDMEDNIIVGSGFDDKVGIALIYEIIKRCDDVKAIITNDEEIGMVGSLALTDKFFEDVTCMITLDRAGHFDLCNKSNGIVTASEDLVKDLLKYLPHLKKATGRSSDTGVFTMIQGVQSVNISCGYFNAHTDQEYYEPIYADKLIEGISDFINESAQIYSEIPLKIVDIKQFIRSHSKLSNSQLIKLIKESV